MDAELMAKLAKRLTVIEPHEPHNHVDTAQSHYEMPQQLIENHGNADTEDAEAKQQRRGKVQVPSWVVESDGSPRVWNRFRPMPWIPGLGALHGGLPFAASGRSCASSSREAPSIVGQVASRDMSQQSSLPAATAFVGVQPTESDAELLARLRMVEMERDAALHDVEMAEAAAARWRADLEEEAQRLRDLRRSLATELAELRGQGFDRETTPDLSSSAVESSSCELAAAMHEIHSLKVQLYRTTSQKEAMQARLLSLETELEHQESECERLHEQLVLSEQQEAKLRPVEDSERPQLLTRGSGLLEQPVVTPRTGVAPPPAAHFILGDNDDSEEEFLEPHPASTSTAAPDAQVHDLEFAYEYGLEATSKMSVERALHLAEWAARLSSRGSSRESHRHHSKSARTQAEESFKPHLAELESALAVLRSAKRSGSSSRVVSRQGSGFQRRPGLEEFEQPVAQLQQVLARIQSKQEKPVEAVKAEPAKSKKVKKVVDKTGVTKDFTEDIKRLQEVTRMLGLTTGGASSPAACSNGTV